MGCSSSSSHSVKTQPPPCDEMNISLQKIERVRSKGSGFPKLSWEDFHAVPEKGSNFYAYSYWNVYYNYEVKISDGRARITMHAKCLFDNKRSWVKEDRKSQDLLEHEQGHYYIGCLCALTFKKKANSMTFSAKNYKSEVRRLFDETLEEFIKIEKLYDTETDHYCDRPQQKRWDQSLFKQIEDLKTFWWPEVVQISENARDIEIVAGV